MPRSIDKTPVVVNPPTVIALVLELFVPVSVSSVSDSLEIIFFFSSRRRHTRFLNVTGGSDVCSSDLRRQRPKRLEYVPPVVFLFGVMADDESRGSRSEERRVGKECRIGCRSRWSP